MGRLAVAEQRVGRLEPAAERAEAVGMIGAVSVQPAAPSACSDRIPGSRPVLAAALRYRRRRMPGLG